jgi:tRNA/rRNA methyltransferase
MSLKQIRIILVRPEEAGNVGAAARVLKNFGLRHLVLVQPRLARPKEAYKWAHGSEDVLEGADVVESLEEALAPCVRAWATTRRRGKHRGGVRTPREAAEAMAELGGSGQNVAWVFGPESSGLSTEELSLCSERVQIPTSPGQPSLNLAQAVAVCCYDSFMAGRTPGRSRASRLATVGERTGLYEHLEAALLQVGFLLPHTARTRMSALRQLIERAQPTPSETRLLRGMARRIQRAGKEADRKDS